MPKEIHEEKRERFLSTPKEKRFEMMEKLWRESLVSSFSINQVIENDEMLQMMELGDENEKAEILKRCRPQMPKKVFIQKYLSAENSKVFLASLASAYHYLDRGDLSDLQLENIKQRGFSEGSEGIMLLSSHANLFYNLKEDDMKKVFELGVKKVFTEQVFMNLSLYEEVFFKASPVFLKRVLLEFPVVAQISMARYRDRMVDFDFSRTEWDLFKKSAEEGPLDKEILVEHLAVIEPKLEAIWSAAELKARFTKGEKSKVKVL